MSNDPKVLDPLFGSYCRTESFRWLTSDRPGEHIMHVEAYIDDPIRKTWTVQLVDSILENRNSVFKPVHSVEAKIIKKGMNFLEVLDLLGSFEKHMGDEPKQFSASLPNAALLDFLHYRAFAEREGYVYDVNGIAYARPAAQALPPGSAFMGVDIARANKNLQRPNDAFGTQSQIPQSHFIFDRFRIAAEKRALPETRVISLMDQFASHIAAMHGKLETYCASYEQLGKGGLVVEAEQSLDTACSVLNQLKAYGLDVSGFEKFSQECRASCAMVHAIGIYNLMTQGMVDTVTSEPLFQKRLAEAQAAYKKVDPSQDGQDTLKYVVTHAERPFVSSAIKVFLESHKKARADFYNAPRLHNPPKP